MRLILASLAVVAAAATPAFANEARVEVRSGLAWNDGKQAEATIGAAAGYDVNVGPAFVGIEQSVDKTLTSNEKVRWGTSGRIGIEAQPGTKLYATAGYNYGAGPNATDIGAGIEKGFGPLYGKVEYKHFFTEQGATDSNAALVGVGVKF